MTRRQTMSELLLALSLIMSGALSILVVSLWRKVVSLAKALAMALQGLNNVLLALSELSGALEAQNGLNQEVNRNLEILGVHTKLLRPSIGFEAESFLANYNRKKGKDNG
jgi:hypothetical protein